MNQNKIYDELPSPADFYDEAPPERIMSAECEYSVQLPESMDLWSSGALAESTIEAAGFKGISEFLDNGARVYYDRGQLIEYAAAEARGPRRATAVDFAGIEVIRKLVETSGAEFRGVYRTAGTCLPIVDCPTRPSQMESIGYHENLLLASDNGGSTASHLEDLLPGYLASRQWSGGGLLRDKGYANSQKAWGIGTITGGITTSHGQKPMFGLRQDTVEQHAGWQRLEVRFADPNLSATARYLAFASLSMVTRLAEHMSKLDHGMQKQLMDMQLAQPVKAAHVYGWETGKPGHALTVGGEQLPASEIQARLLAAATRLHNLIELTPDEAAALPLWEQTIDQLARRQPGDPFSDELAGKFDMAARHHFLIHRQERGELDRQTTRDPVAVRRNLAWDRVIPAGPGLKWWDLHPSSYVPADLIESYVHEPPADTRAAARSKLIRQGTVDYVNWSSANDHTKDFPRLMPNPYQHLAPEE